LAQEIEPKVVAIDLSAVLDIEYTALKMFIEGEKRQREQGRRLWLVSMNPHVLEMVQKSPLGEALGRDCMHFNLEIAVAKFLGAAPRAGKETS
jgi:MFS superfamily sulfate permease-like transporter